MRRPAVVLALLLVGPALAGCLAETDAGTGSLPGDDAAEPRVELPEPITGFEMVGSVDGVESGEGIFADGDRLYVAGGQTGFYTVDISEPRNASVLGQIRERRDGEPLDSRDVDVLHYPNRTVAALASSADGMYLVDVTDPSAPEHLTTILGGGLAQTEGGNVHNLAVVPGTHVIYNSRSVDTPGIDVVDASDPEDPEVVRTFGDLTCHDVSFWTEGERAYCAGVRETQIWDIADPEHPEVVGTIVNPAIQIHHATIPARNGSLLVVLDEFAGSTAAAAGCFAEEDGRSDPVGAAWFYDVSDESQPEPLGWIAPDVPVGNDLAPCTAHFGTTVGEGRDLAVIGWRTAGTYLVDFEDPTAPRFVDAYRADTETWEARYHRGAIYAGDSGQGLHVFGLLGG